MEDFITEPGWGKAGDQPVDYAKIEANSERCSLGEELPKISQCFSVGKPWSEETKYTRKTFKAKPLSYVVTQEK